MAALSAACGRASTRAAASRLPRQGGAAAAACRQLRAPGRRARCRAAGEKATEADSKLQVPDTPPSKASLSQEQTRQQEQQPAATSSATASQQELDDISLSIDEIRQRASQLRSEAKKESLMEGVLEEVRLIRWPTPQAALVQTLLVVALVGATSVLLFTVNTLLNELSQLVYS